MSEPMSAAPGERGRPKTRAAPADRGAGLWRRGRDAWRRITSGSSRIQGMVWPIPYVLLSGGLAALLVRAQRRLGQLRQREELRLREAEEAREVQLATLTERPSHPLLEIAVRFEPAEEVGGDFYSFFTAGTRVGVILGDVSGKGTPAALGATSICHLARWLRPMQDPPGFLANLNRTLLEQTPTETFASMITAFLDPDAEKLVIFNAGHPPGLIISGDSVRCTQQSNLPLGMFADAKFVAEPFPFGRGDTLAIYSDGFIETRNAVGEMLSVEGLEAFVRRHAARPLEELATCLVDETRAFGTVTDDLTLVLVRYRLPRPGLRRRPDRRR